MPAPAIPRRKASFAFTIGAFGLLALLTGVAGFELRGHYGPDTRPLGYWTGDIVWPQVVAGIVCVIVASVIAYRINRSL
jgi:hypothetical protein